MTAKTTSLYSDDISCPSCIGKITDRLDALDGVERAAVHTGTGRIEIVHDPERARVTDLVAAVADAGYAAAPRGF